MEHLFKALKLNEPHQALFLLQSCVSVVPKLTYIFGCSPVYTYPSCLQSNWQPWRKFLAEFPISSLTTGPGYKRHFLFAEAAWAWDTPKSSRSRPVWPRLTQCTCWFIRLAALVGNRFWRTRATHGLRAPSWIFPRNPAENIKICGTHQWSTSLLTYYFSSPAPTGQ